MFWSRVLFCFGSFLCSPCFTFLFIIQSALVGLYIIYVRDWLRRFPTDQVLFLRSDGWFEGQKQNILLKTYHFLDIGKL